MRQFIILHNQFLKLDIMGYYNTDYLGYRKPNNPDFLNVFKNTYNSFAIYKLNKAYNTVKSILYSDIKLIYNVLGQPRNFKICVVPCSKANLQETQLYFNKAVTDTVKNIELDISKYTTYPVDNKNTIIGTDYIKRHTNTYTTHLGKKAPNYINDGKKVYIGITKDTCHISQEVDGNHILLIDDIYTEDVNIDEDAIQALLDNGATGVTFYAVAKTVDIRKQRLRDFDEEEWEREKEERQRELDDEAIFHKNLAEWLRQDEMGAYGRD